VSQRSSPPIGAGCSQACGEPMGIFRCDFFFLNKDQLQRSSHLIGSFEHSKALIGSPAKALIGARFHWCPLYGIHSLIGSLNGLEKIHKYISLVLMIISPLLIPFFIIFNLYFSTQLLFF
jgi:hypothetical protein